VRCPGHPAGGRCGLCKDIASPASLVRMTLVLAVATPAYCLHVSDRLVSKGGHPHDSVANKSVVFRARDGLLAFGYTGLAFLEAMPTDTWIAHSLSRRPAELGSIAYGRFPVLDVGTSLLVLRERLEARRRFQGLGGEVSAVGWQWSNKRRRSSMRDVLWLLRSESATLKWDQLVPRHLPERKAVFRMAATGHWPLEAQEWRELLEEVGGAGENWELVERLLIRAIRGSSTLTPGTIGPHCMSILLRPWRFPNALIRFCANSPHEGVAFDESVEIAYTPWMVAADAIHAPAVLVGGLTCEQGLLSYAMEAPDVRDDQRLKGAFQSQDRPRG